MMISKPRKVTMLETPYFRLSWILPSIHHISTLVHPALATTPIELGQASACFLSVAVAFLADSKIFKPSFGALSGSVSLKLCSVVWGTSVAQEFHRAGSRSDMDELRVLTRNDVSTVIHA